MYEYYKSGGSAITERLYMTLNRIFPFKKKPQNFPCPRPSKSSLWMGIRIILREEDIFTLLPSISAERRVYRTEREEIGFYQVLLGGCYSICREGHGDYLLHILLLKFFKNK